MKALEVRINSVMAERRKSQMQTLGAKNEYGNNNGTRNNNKRNSTASIPVSEVFENGKVNQGFEEEIYGTRGSLPMQARGSVSWKSSNNSNNRK